MSKLSVGPCKVMLVETFERGNMSAEAYTNRLEAVLSIIDNGAIALTGIGYGCAGHIAALDAVESQIAKTRKAIAGDES